MRHWLRGKSAARPACMLPSHGVPGHAPVLPCLAILRVPATAARPARSCAALNTHCLSSKCVNQPVCRADWHRCGGQQQCCMHTVMCFLAAEVCPLQGCRRQFHLHSKLSIQAQAAKIFRAPESGWDVQAAVHRGFRGTGSQQQQQQAGYGACEMVGWSGSQCLYALQTSALSVHRACRSLPESRWGVETAVDGGFRGAGSQQQRAGYALLAKARHSLPASGRAHPITTAQDLP